MDKRRILVGDVKDLENRNIIVPCPTKKEADMLMIILNALGYFWLGGKTGDLLDNSYWECYKKRIAYRIPPYGCRNNIYYGSVEYYEFEEDIFSRKNAIWCNVKDFVCLKPEFHLFVPCDNCQKSTEFPCSYTYTECISMKELKKSLDTIRRELNE